MFNSMEQEFLPNISELGCDCPQVLVVDDIGTNRYIIKEYLSEKFGLSIDEATNGKECLKIIKEKSLSECCSSYKIIFMDFQMDEMNGIEAT